MEAAAATDDGPDAKRARTNDTDDAPKGTMPDELRATIEASLAAIGTVEYHRRPHRKGPGPVQPRTLPPEDLVHEKVETIRSGSAQRVHYRCSNPKCPEPIRNDRWETHKIKMTTDR